MREAAINEGRQRTTAIGRGRRLSVEGGASWRRAAAIGGGRQLLVEDDGYRQRVVALGGRRRLSAEGGVSWWMAVAIGGWRRLLVEGGGYLSWSWDGRGGSIVAGNLSWRQVNRAGQSFVEAGRS